MSVNTTCIKCNIHKINAKYRVDQHKGYCTQCARKLKMKAHGKKRNKKFDIDTQIKPLHAPHLETSKIIVNNDPENKTHSTYYNTKVKIKEEPKSPPYLNNKPINTTPLNIKIHEKLLYDLFISHEINFVFRPKVLSFNPSFLINNVAIFISNSGYMVPKKLNKDYIRIALTNSYVKNNPEKSFNTICTAANLHNKINTLKTRTLDDRIKDVPKILRVPTPAEARKKRRVNLIPYYKRCSHCHERSMTKKYTIKPGFGYCEQCIKELKISTEKLNHLIKNKKEMAHKQASQSPKDCVKNVVDTLNKCANKKQHSYNKCLHTVKTCIEHIEKFKKSTITPKKFDEDFKVLQQQVAYNPCRDYPNDIVSTKRLNHLNSPTISKPCIPFEKIIYSFFKTQCTQLLAKVCCMFANDTTPLSSEISNWNKKVRTVAKNATKIIKELGSAVDNRECSRPI